MSFYSEENRQLLLGLLKNNPTYINNSNYFIKEFNITMHNTSKSFHPAARIICLGCLNKSFKTKFGFTNKL